MTSIIIFYAVCFAGVVAILLTCTEDAPDNIDICANWEDVKRGRVD